jgi:hypothetical protein
MAGVWGSPDAGLTFFLTNGLHSGRLATLVEDAGEGELLLRDFSHVFAREEYHASHRVLVLDEFSKGRPLFSREAGLFATSRWDAVVGMIPVEVEGELATMAAATGELACQRCVLDVCRTRASESSGRVCTCCTRPK